MGELHATPQPQVPIRKLSRPTQLRETKQVVVGLVTSTNATATYYRAPLG